MQWYHYVIIAAGAVILILLIISLVSGKKEEKKVITKEAPREPTIISKIEPTVIPRPITPKPVDPKPVTPKPTVKDKPTEQPESKAVDDKVAKYHISQNKDEKSPRFKQWRVRKEGSNKTIKYFQTQKEAIEYAEGLADNADSSIVIHKVDGSIRKQDYTKKV